jgi:UDPglucose 6-dehydrogenase
VKIAIAVAGIGYVGLSNAIFLAQHNTVLSVDISARRVAMLNARQAPITDPDITSFLVEKPLDLVATTDAAHAYVDAEYVLVATPTNYHTHTNHFDISSVEAVIAQVIAVNQKATIIVKSTVPVGFTARVSTQMDTTQVIFSPEFLREGRALYDCLTSAHMGPNSVI